MNVAVEKLSSIGDINPVGQTMSGLYYCLVRTYEWLTTEEISSGDAFQQKYLGFNTKTKTNFMMNLKAAEVAGELKGLSYQIKTEVDRLDLKRAEESKPWRRMEPFHKVESLFDEHSVRELYTRYQSLVKEFEDIN